MAEILKSELKGNKQGKTKNFNQIENFKNMVVSCDDKKVVRPMNGLNHIYF